MISDKKDAYALERARKHRIEACYLDPKKYAGREDYDRAVISLIKERDIDLVVLAGYMRLLSPVFIDAFPGRIMNIHPSLLPSFPGLEGVSQALRYGVKVSGCTVFCRREPRCRTGYTAEAMRFTIMIQRNLCTSVFTMLSIVFTQKLSSCLLKENK